MTRDEFMTQAREAAGRILESKENGIMNLVQQAWAEGKKNAEIGYVSEIVIEALSGRDQRLYAHWEPEKNRERHWHCSNCRDVWGIACINMSYCPHCGASMAEHPEAPKG